MAKAETKEVATTNNALPAYLQGQAKTARLGNVEQSDLIIPRVKLLQAISPELDSFDAAKKGEFWHNVASESLGAELRAIPLLMRKTYVLWAPRNDDRGILARSSDGIMWDDQFQGLEFTVKPKNSPHNVTYKLGKSVHESVDGGVPLSEFGSSIPGDPQSAPAAALTYQFLFFFPDHPDLSPAVILNTRSSAKKGKDLISKIELRPVDHYAQVYRIGIKQENGDEGPYYNYDYTSAGYADEGDYNTARMLYEKFSTETNWRADDENADVDSRTVDSNGGGRGRSGPADSEKF